MKRLLLYSVLLLNVFLLLGCSLKHKRRNKQQENITHRKQEYLRDLLTTEHRILDTSLQYSHSQLKHYRLWYLSGNVHIHPNGSFQTDQAIIQSWHSAADSQQTLSFRSTYQNQRVEQEAIAEESTDVNKKSSYKEKWKFTTNLWWLVLLVIPLGIWRFRRRY